MQDNHVLFFHRNTVFIVQVFSYKSPVHNCLLTSFMSRFLEPFFFFEVFLRV